MNRIDAFKKDLGKKRAIKVIAGIDNFDLERISNVVKAAEQGNASAVDIAYGQEIFDMVRELTDLPVFVSSIKPAELAEAVNYGADAIEIGNFDTLYKKGTRMDADKVLALVKDTLSLINSREIFISVTIPGHIEVEEQIKLAHKLEELNIDLIQTEGAATVEAQSNGARGLLETAQVSISNTMELSINTEIPIMTASGITTSTSQLAFAAGASAVGVGSCINKLDSVLSMIAVVRTLVEKASTASAREIMNV